MPGEFQSNGTWRIQSPDGTAKQLLFGQVGDVPLVGDWSNKGEAAIGIFRPSNTTWYLDQTMDGKADIEFQFEGMRTGDIPLMGDWDGNGTATPGYFRAKDASWHLRNSNTSGAEDWPVIQFGISTDMPLSGDWDGDGRDTIGIYRPTTGAVELKNDLTSRPGQISFTAPAASQPVVANWSGQGIDSLAFVSGRQWVQRLVNCNCHPSNPPPPFEFGTGQGVPVAGNWKNLQ